MSKRTLIGWLGAGVVLVTAAFVAWMLMQPGGVRGVLVRWFGPPQVVMAESHAADIGIEMFDHAILDDLLQDHVDAGGRVNYEGLAARRAALDGYLVTLAAADLDTLGRDERLALLLNAYNAFTLALILDHYPLDSIRDIPGADRWNAVRWNLAGEVVSLDAIEHERIRPAFREPRVHFALVCAAVGCPPLRAEAYSAARLEEQLEDQARRISHDAHWTRYAPGAVTIEVTSLYEWYRGDFDQTAGSVLAFVAGYREDLAADLAAGRTPKVRYLPYDWSLNRQ